MMRSVVGGLLVTVMLGTYCDQEQKISSVTFSRLGIMSEDDQGKRNLLQEEKNSDHTEFCEKDSDNIKPFPSTLGFSGQHFFPCQYRLITLYSALDREGYPDREPISWQ